MRVIITNDITNTQRDIFGDSVLLVGDVLQAFTFGDNEFMINQTITEAYKLAHGDFLEWEYDNE